MNLPTMYVPGQDLQLPKRKALDFILMLLRRSPRQPLQM